VKRIPAVLAVAVAVVSSLTTIVGAAEASAGAPVTQDRPSSTWVQPGTGPLDGMGAFVFPTAPVPTAAQGSPLGYEYTVLFRFQDQTAGILALGYQHGHKVAGFGLIPGQLVATVPFDWSFGHVYFLFTYRLGPAQWGAWVYDVVAASWTFIAQQAAPGTAGGITPTSTTGIDYDSTSVPAPAADQSTCSFYPRVDVYFFAPIGWRGATPTVATLGTNAVDKGDCPSSTTMYFGWQHYGLGTTAAA